MNDLNDKITERWTQRRKKGYNWPKLIIMVIILIALLYGMNFLKRGPVVVNTPMADTADTTMTVIPPAEQNP